MSLTAGAAARSRHHPLQRERGASPRGVTSVFLPHGIGHLLGLEVHDVGGFMAGPRAGRSRAPTVTRYLRLTRVLEKGFVVTMEPGIYFIAQLLEAARGGRPRRPINWSRVEALTRFGGIRIEDDLAVTAGGCENLTRDAFAPKQRMPVRADRITGETIPSVLPADP